MLRDGCVDTLWRPLMLCAALAANGLAQSDRATLTGTVKDSSDTPVALARLSVVGLRGISDSVGRFLLSGLPAGAATLNVRRLGFAPRDMSLQLVGGRTDSVFVVLAMLPRELEGITTESDAIKRTWLADFYRHRRGGIGHFFDRREIEERHAQRISDILRRLPGVRIMTDRNGRSRVRMGRTSGGRDCAPDFWIDGVLAVFLGVDDLPLSDVEALEVHSGPAGLPPELNSRIGNPGCGAIVIWTRLPG